MGQTDTEARKDWLAKAGILVRKMEVYGIKNALRITIGKSEENRKLISKMKRILNV